jgi:hypothetical protein
VLHFNPITEKNAIGQNAVNNNRNTFFKDSAWLTVIGHGQRLSTKRNIEFGSDSIIFDGPLINNTLNTLSSSRFTA